MGFKWANRMPNAHNPTIENIVMAALQILEKIGPWPQLSLSDYFLYQDKPTGWLSASDKIKGWARIRTDKDDILNMAEE